jgi:3-phosphoshikimate 1-carboxyvinyltransferase
VDLTIDLMKKFGVSVQRQGYEHFIVTSGQKYKALEFNVPIDCSSANYFLAAAAIVPGTVEIEDPVAEIVQPESKFSEILEKMGCAVKKTNGTLRIKGTINLKPVDVDMSAMPDAVQTLAAVASFSKGITTIRNIGHLKYKESDRISETARELKKLGVDVEAHEDKLVIKGSKLAPAIIDPHNDHRMAMSFALIGLKIPGIKIKNPECVKKSFPEFWKTLKKIGAGIKNV